MSEVEKGLFKKRIKEEINFDNYIGWKEQEAFSTMRQKVLEVVEGFKKEFAKALIYLPRGTTEDKLENLLNERILIKQCIEHWFSE